MSKLNQIIAVEGPAKKKYKEELTELYQLLGKPAVLAGISRSYTPKQEDGDTFPSESTRVQLRAKEALEAVKGAISRAFDVVALKDYTNCVATGDIVVDGEKILTGVPVTYLLFLEKELVDLHTFVKKLPTLDPSEEWTFSDAQDCYATSPTQTAKTKKTPFAFVKAPATEQHPAQVEVFHEDVVVGYWQTIKYSGALPASDVSSMLERVEALQAAVKYAREQANSIDTVQQPKVADAILGYIFK